MSDPVPSFLDDLPPLREVIARHGLRAEKKFGQNFLLDGNLTDKIARAAGDLSAATVIEIGPGPGGLTRSLLRAGAREVVAIEYDPRACTALEDLAAAAGGRLRVVEGDALRLNPAALTPEAGERVIVANLPYNIATPLLTGWLRQVREAPGTYGRMVLMFQREVAQRIAAGPGGKDYGRLSVLTQWLCEARVLFTLPPQAFTPAPKVSSAVIRLDPRPPVAGAPAFAAVEAVTAAAFGQRRKMLRSALRDYQAEMERLCIDAALRAEALTPSQYAALAAAAGLRS